MMSIMCCERKVSHGLCQSYDFVLKHGRSFQICQCQKWNKCYVPFFCEILVLVVIVIFMSSVLPNGSVVGVVATPCVSQGLLEENDSWKRAGASVNDVLDRLRLKCVPSGYTPMPWSAGMLYAYALRWRGELVQRHP